MTSVERLRTRRVVVQVGVVAAVVALAWFVVFSVSPRPAWHDLFDLRVYRGAVQWWLEGHKLYAFRLGHTVYGFTYPPFAALCLLPMALVPLKVAAVVHTALSLAAIVAVTAWLVVPVARRHGWVSWFAVAVALPVVLALEPIRETLGYGQINMLLFALVIADVVAIRRGRRWAGVGIGLAAAVKLTPGLFVVHLLATRRFRAAAVAAGTFAGAALLAFAVDERTSWAYWTHEVFQTSRVGRLSSVSNQSLLGLLARIAEPGLPDMLLWAVLAAIVAAAALWRAARADRAGDELAGFTLVGLASCVVSPISWTHHLYWVVPAVVVLVDVAAGTPPSPALPQLLPRRPAAVRLLSGGLAAAVLVVFGLSLLWVGVPPPGTRARDHTGALGGDLYVVAFLLLLALLPVRRLSGSAEPSAARTTGRPRPAGSSPR